MIRSALVLCVGILAMAGVPGLSFVTSAAAQPACNAAGFVGAVKVLAPSYSLNATPGFYVPPLTQTLPGYTLRAEIKQDLTDAFNNAPKVVQDSLCKLTGVFISSSGCANGDVNNCSPFTSFLFSGDGSWGFRSWQADDVGSTYIAISGGLWNSGSSRHSQSFSFYENWLLPYFLPYGASATIASATPNYPWMTVLAALAHELGHVRWAQAVIPAGAGEDYDFSLLRHCPLPNGTTIDFFSGWKYNGATKKLRPPDWWRYFAGQDNDAGDPNQRYTEHKNSPLIAVLYYSGYGSSMLNQLVYQLHQYDQPWASLFGAQTPDEDFVEIYVLYALLGKKFDDQGYTGAYLQSLPVSIPGYPDADIPRDLLAGNKATLSQKVQCVRGLP